MYKIYSCQDRIPIKVGEITIVISPLHYLDKQVLRGLSTAACQDDVSETVIMEAARYALKAGIKDIYHAVDGHGNPYKLEFDETGKYLSEKCIDDLMNLPVNNQIISICSSLLHNVPDEITNPFTGKPMEGVKILPMEGASDPLA